ncbi:MAG: cell division protein FtsA [Salibacteraceae bacterium]
MSNKATDYVVGLDIGTTKIAVLIGRKNEHGKLEILAMGKAPSPGVSRGVVTHITPTVDAIKEAIRQAEEQSGVTVREVNVGIAGQHIRSIQHRGVKIRDSYEDEITEKDVEALKGDMYRLVMQPGEEIIDVIPQEYIVDNEQGITDPVGMSGGRLEANFHLIIAQVAAVKNIAKCVERAGLKVMEITLEPLASAEAVLHEDEKEAGVALVDIGGGTTDLAIFQENIIRHSAVIPFGGNVISEDIKEGCSIIRKQAELLKLKFGSALSSENLDNEIISIPGLRGRQPKEISVKNLAHIIEARMTEIIEQVYYEIRNSGMENKLIAGIVVTGGGSQLKHITQLFEFTTGMDTRIGYPAEHLAAGTEEITSPTFSTGVGLVLKGYDYLQHQIKLNGVPQSQSNIKSSEEPKIVDAQNNETVNEVESEGDEAISEMDDNLNFSDETAARHQGLFTRFIDKAKTYLEGDE